MAIKLLAVNDVYNIREAKYIVDEENEKDLIPNEDKVQGTKVLVIKGNKEYRMNSAGNWVEIVKNGGGGSSLPPVTAENNGDLLGVVNGEWGKTDAPYTVEEITDETVIFEEDEITLVDQQGLGVANLVGISALPQSGDTLSVIWNGDVYECTAQTFQGSIFAGNASVFDGNPDWSEYPFLLFMTDNGGQVGGQVLAEHSGTATLAVTIEDTTKTITVSDAFVDAVTEANNEAKKTWIIPKTLVSYTEDTAPDGYIDIPVSAAALSDINQKLADGSLANTIAFINGNELPYSADDSAWVATVGGTEYYMYYNTSPGPVVDGLGISITTGDGYVYGDYSVGLFTRSGETLTVVFTENGGNYSCDTPLATIGEALSNGTPINTFLIEGSTRLYPYVLTVVGTSVVAVFHVLSAKTDYFEIKTLTLELASDNTVTATEATKDLQYHQGVN